MYLFEKHRGCAMRRRDLRLTGVYAAVGAALIATSARADCSPDRAASLSMDLWHGHPVIQASIGGRTVPMVVDTGAERTTVTPETASALGLPRDSHRQTWVNTVGGEEVTGNVLLSLLKIADLHFSQLSAAVVPLSGAGTDSEQVAGGLIGANLIGNFDVEFDFPQRRLTLYQRSNCSPVQPPWSGPYQTVPVQISARRQVLLPVVLNGYPLTAEFDTGSRGETVALAVAERIGITQTQLDSDPLTNGTSAGLHEYAIHRHRFETFKIGDETFHNAPLDVVDFSQTGIDMLVGVDYMSKRRFYISYAAGILFVQADQGGSNAPSTSPADAALKADDRCRPPPSLLPTLSHLKPTAISRPSLSVPERVKVEKIDGCAGVAFRLGSDGTPFDLKLATESPEGRGLGNFVMQQITATKFTAPAGQSDQWYYEAHRVRPTQRKEN